MIQRKTTQRTLLAAMIAFGAVACGEEPAVDEAQGYQDEAIESAQEDVQPTVSDEAQDQRAVTVSTARSDEFGVYLADQNGRPLYVFTADKRESLTLPNKLACVGQCLQAWPPLTTKETPRAAGAVQPQLISKIDVAQGPVVTYDGWPLYYFARDSGAQLLGHNVESYGGVWRLIGPDARPIGEATRK